MISLDGPGRVQHFELTVWANDSNSLRTSNRSVLAVKKNHRSLHSNVIKVLNSLFLALALSHSKKAFDICEINACCDAKHAISG